MGSVGPSVALTTPYPTQQRIQIQYRKLLIKHKRYVLWENHYKLCLWEAGFLNETQNHHHRKAKMGHHHVSTRCLWEPGVILAGLWQNLNYEIMPDASDLVLLVLAIVSEL